MEAKPKPAIPGILAANPAKMIARSYQSHKFQKTFQFYGDQKFNFHNKYVRTPFRL